jgi:mannose/fructose/N-acetylgalactosamine-specific phosphotransferase system component IID
MLDLILFLLAIFVIYNFAEYKALKYGYKKGGIKGMLRMMVAIIVRLFTGLFIHD